MTADINTFFCSAQAVFATDANVDSTDWVNIQVAQDMAGAQAPVVEIAFTTTPAGGTSMKFQLLACDSAGANGVVIDETPTITIASGTMVAPTAGVGTNMGGRRLSLKMSPKHSLPAATLTHLRLRTVNVGANSAGAITAQLVPEGESQHPNKNYPAGY